MPNIIAVDGTTRSRCAVRPPYIAAKPSSLRIMRKHWNNPVYLRRSFPTGACRSLVRTTWRVRINDDKILHEQTSHLMRIRDTGREKLRASGSGHLQCPISRLFPVCFTCPFPFLILFTSQRASSSAHTRSTAADFPDRRGSLRSSRDTGP